jgi:hypothetical protein
MDITIQTHYLLFLFESDPRIQYKKEKTILSDLFSSLLINTGGMSVYDGKGLKKVYRRYGPKPK